MTVVLLCAQLCATGCATSLLQLRRGVGPLLGLLWCHRSVLLVARKLLLAGDDCRLTL